MTAMAVLVNHLFLVFKAMRIFLLCLVFSSDVLINIFFVYPKKGLIQEG